VEASEGTGERNRLGGRVAERLDPGDNGLRVHKRQNERRDDGYRRKKTERYSERGENEEGG